MSLEKRKVVPYLYGQEWVDKKSLDDKFDSRISLIDGPLTSAYNRNVDWEAPGSQGYNEEFLLQSPQKVGGSSLSKFAKEGEYLVRDRTGGYVNVPNPPVSGGFLPALLPIIGTIGPIVAPLIAQGISALINLFKKKKQGSGLREKALTLARHPMFQKLLRKSEEKIKTAKGGNFLQTIFNVAKSLLSSFIPNLLGSGYVGGSDELSEEILKPIVGGGRLLNFPLKDRAQKGLQNLSQLLSPIIQTGLSKGLKLMTGINPPESLVNHMYKLIKRNVPMMGKGIDIETIKGGSKFSDLIKYLKMKAKKVVDYVRTSPSLIGVLNNVLKKAIVNIKKGDSIDAIMNFIDGILTAKNIDLSFSKVMRNLIKKGVQFIPDDISIPVAKTTDDSFDKMDMIPLTDKEEILSLRKEDSISPSKNEEILSETPLEDIKELIEDRDPSIRREMDLIKPEKPVGSGILGDRGTQRRRIIKKKKIQPKKGGWVVRVESL